MAPIKSQTPILSGEIIWKNYILTQLIYTVHFNLYVTADPLVSKPESIEIEDAAALSQSGTSLKRRKGQVCKQTLLTNTLTPKH